MINKLRKHFLWIGLVVVATITFAFVSSNSEFEISKNLDIFATLYRDVNAYYVGDIEPNKFMRTGIDAMLKSLDPYTNFISEAEIENYRFQTTGLYGGIGAVIRKVGDKTVVIEPYEGFPAFKAGIRAGDLLLQIDDVSTDGKSSDDISKILKGTPGTDVTVVIQHPNETTSQTLKLTREEIKVKSVPYYGMLNDHIGYIRLTQFTDKCGQEVADAFTDLKSKNDLQGLIFDLRGNPGGLLNEAVNIANIFVEKGKEIVSTKGKVDSWDKSYTALNNALDTQMPLVVLANSGSASASEIVSGCLQDLDRAVILGQKTFGKGLVQTTRTLSFGTQLKVTTAHYFTPSGRCIQALDYSHRNDDGSVGKIPDSLKTAFKTAAGRVVYDGGGIDPDVVTTAKKLSLITTTLLSKNLIFDFATNYALAHPSIDNAKVFSVTENDWNDFLTFLNGKDYEYDTKSETDLQQFKKTAEAEHYFDDVKDDYETMMNKISHHTSEDLQTNKSEIMEMLREEIVSRYYFQKGRVESSLTYDADVLQAVTLLQNAEAYQKLLTVQK